MTERLPDGTKIKWKGRRGQVCRGAILYYINDERIKVESLQKSSKIPVAARYEIFADRIIEVIKDD